MADRMDLDAIAADDALLDLLAAGGEFAWEAGEHDPALKLLADLRSAVEVEDELPVETIDDPENFLARCAALNPVTDPLARKIAARGLALGVAAVAALSVSGVAAAVTGDPLSPYEKVIEKVVDGLRPQTSFPKEQLDGMPAVDKTKLVKVVKDYRDKQQGQLKYETDQRLNPNLVDPPQDLTIDPRPPLAIRPTPTMVAKPNVDKPIPVATEKPAVVKPTVTTPPPTVATTPPPTVTTTPPPAVTPSPTDPPVPTDPPPPSTDTTSPPSTPTDQPAAAEGNGTDASGNETSTSTPQGETAQPGTGSQTDSNTQGDQPTPTGSTTSSDVDATSPGSTTSSDDDTTSSDAKSPGGTTSSDDDATLTEHHTQPTVPSPAGPSSTEQARAKSSKMAEHKSSARHSNGKHALGYANAKYAKGKHSSGHYAEGKHAALSRAHGSMAPKTLRQILVVINGVMEPVRTD